jgi:hypothetical protein
MRFAFVLPALLGLLMAASQPAPRLSPVALELFTSQGCSSCPPADALVEKLAKEPNIVVFSRPVTYWDRLGWKDSLAREANTELQRAYAKRGQAGAGVYTPQVVIQGADAAVGSDEAALRRLIAGEKRKPGPQIIARATPAGGRIIDISAGQGSTADIFVVALRGSAIVKIGSGENGGRVVRYTNVVVDENKVGGWRGDRQRIVIEPGLLRNKAADRYALLMRAGPAGRIVAARYI